MDKVLLFSGGKDSLAVLELLRESGELAEVMVIWVDSGDSYPEKWEMMRKMGEEIDWFQVVSGNQPRYVREVGWPCDVLPEELTEFGHKIRGRQGVQLVSVYDCCRANLWDPAAWAIREEGAKVVYRGDRRTDSRRAPLEDGAVVDGITYRFPVLDWTDEDVLAYVGDRLPVHYKEGERTSRDCMTCTAYLDETGPRVARLPEPKQSIVRFVLQEQRKALIAGLRNIEEVLDHG